MEDWVEAHIPKSGVVEARYANVNAAGESWVTFDFATGAWSLVLPEYWVRVGADGGYDLRDPGQKSPQHLATAPQGVACAVEEYIPLVAVRNLLGRTDLEVHSGASDDGGVVVTIKTSCGSHCTNPAVLQLPPTQERVVLSPDGRVVSWTFDAGGNAATVAYEYDPRSPARCQVVSTALRGTQHLADVRWLARSSPNATTAEALDARCAESRAAKAEWIARKVSLADAVDSTRGSELNAAGPVPGAAYRAPVLWTGVILVIAGGYAAWRARRSIR